MLFNGTALLDVESFVRLGLGSVKRINGPIHDQAYLYWGNERLEQSAKIRGSRVAMLELRG